MSMESRIRQKLQAAFAPTYLDLVNESHMHSVPKGSESHFRLVLVSEKFEGLSRVARSRLVHECLAEELKNGVHALSHKTISPEEWAEMNESVEMASPPCYGGSAVDQSTGQSSDQKSGKKPGQSDS